MFDDSQLSFFRVVNRDGRTRLPARDPKLMRAFMVGKNDWESCGSLTYSGTLELLTP
jgi:hypothetical protein